MKHWAEEKERRLILGGSVVQAMRFVRAEGGSQKDYVFLNDPYQLRGWMRGTTIILVGTYFERPDWGEFGRMIQARGFKVEERFQ